MYKFNHFNFNVLDMERSLKFYDEALGLKPVREKEGPDGSYKLIFVGDGESDFTLELTLLRDRTKPYDLGEGEFHLAFAVDDFDAAYKKHKEMGCVCQEPGKIKAYFIEDPDGYWIEIVRSKKAKAAENPTEPKDYLIVVDMQNDFIDGALGSAEAQAIVPNVLEKIKNFDGRVLFTRDTHGENYMDTQEGRKLPVPHCIKDTDGWEIRKELEELRKDLAIDKPTFGSRELAELIYNENELHPIKSVTLIGLCTDICVISNAMLIKAFLPEMPVIVDASCCAGVTPQSHTNALEAMKMCQIEVINQ